MNIFVLKIEITASKLVNPFHETSVDDQRTLQRFARSAQLGGYEAAAPPQYGSPEPAPAPLMPYRFGYAVQDTECNDFNQQEQSDGAQVKSFTGTWKDL